MSEQQKHDLMGILSQGGLDLSADVPTLRAAFNELMARVPVAGDVDQKPTTIGGVSQAATETGADPAAPAPRLNARPGAGGSPALQSIRAARSERAGDE